MIRLTSVPVAAAATTLKHSGPTRCRDWSHRHVLRLRDSLPDAVSWSSPGETCNLTGKMKSMTSVAVAAPPLKHTILVAAASGPIVVWLRTIMPLLACRSLPRCHPRSASDAWQIAALGNRTVSRLVI